MGRNVIYRHGLAHDISNRRRHGRKRRPIINVLFYSQTSPNNAFHAGKSLHRQKNTVTR